MDKNKRILVTGATGFVGAYLLRYLLDRGYTNISALHRHSSPWNLVEDIRDRVTWIEGDILDIFSLEEALDGVELLYHCAAIISMDPRDNQLMRQVNYEGTANVVNMALDAGVEKMLYTSSIAAIGRTKESRTIDEKYSWERSKYNSNYAISKYLAEQEVWRGIAEGLPAVIINPGVIIGSGFWDRGTSVMFQRVWKGLQFFPGGGSGYVDVRDVARMCLQLMESNIAGERFIAVSENCDYKNLFTMVADSLKKGAPQYQLPNWVGELAWRLIWPVSKLTNTKPLLTREMVQMTAKTYVYSNKKSLDQLNFKYLPLLQTIQETGAQFLQAEAVQFRPSLLPLA
ncbi:MAG: NAD-dependent epimerase/dehydratase family protein [Bacteroidota bacterium]